MQKPQLEDFRVPKPSLEEFGMTSRDYERAKATQENKAEWAWAELWVSYGVSILLALILAALGSNLLFCLGVACVGPVVLLPIWFIILPFISGLRGDEAENLKQRNLHLYEQALAYYNQTPARYEQAMAVYNQTLEKHWKSLRGTSLEKELAMLYSKLGYKTRTTRATGDRGVDLILERKGQTIIVQCKGYEKPAGVGVARDLYGALIDFGADKAILACPSGFTKGVFDFVHNKPIEVLDSRKMVAMANNSIR